MGAQLDEISGAIGELREGMRNMRDDQKDLKDDVKRIEGKVDSLNASRWQLRGAVLAIGATGGVVAGKVMGILGTVIAAVKP